MFFYDDNIIKTTVTLTIKTVLGYLQFSSTGFVQIDSKENSYNHLSRLVYIRSHRLSFLHA
jgi:hypothetical protein